MKPPVAAGSVPPERSARRSVDRALAATLGRTEVGRGDHLVIGVSGGPDSVCLAHATQRWARSAAVEVTIAHFDHRWRPESRLDADFVANLAQRLGTGFKVGRAQEDLRPPPHESIEQRARRERWQFLERAADSLGAAAILVGHNRSDQAETFLLRLLRGAGARGLSGMRPIAGRRVRPLLSITRPQILKYLAAESLPYRLDPTNEQPFADRNRIRLEIMPKLQEMRLGAEKTIARAAENLALEGDLVEAAARWASRRLALRRFGNGAQFDRAGFANLETGVQMIVLRELAAQISGQSPRQAVLAQAARFAASPGPHGQLTLSPDAALERSRGQLLLRPTYWRPPHYPDSGTIPVPGSLELPSFGLALATQWPTDQEGAAFDEGPSCHLTLPPGGNAALTIEQSATDRFGDPLLPHWFEARSLVLSIAGQPVWADGVGRLPLAGEFDGNRSGFRLFWRTLPPKRQSTSPDGSY